MTRMNRNLYIVTRYGKLYWGSYMRLPTTNMHEWVYRRIPMKPDRWYGNSKHQVKFEVTRGQFGDKVFMICHRQDTGITYMCIDADRNLTAAFVFGPCGKSASVPPHVAAQHSNAFKNRANEYLGSYLVPMSKGLRHFNERFGVNEETRNLFLPML